MIWWNWKTNQRLLVIAVMVVAATVMTASVGGAAIGWRALVGMASFLFIPQIIAWLLFVGLKTGCMPSAYGRSELRSESPAWFWSTGSLYAGLLLLIVGFLISVLLG